jgi:hypothetical protein
MSARVQQECKQGESKWKKKMSYSSNATSTVCNSSESKTGYILLTAAWLDTVTWP